MSKKDNTIKWEKELKKRGWPSNFQFDFDVNRWGSCQYSSALATYDLYFEMRKELSRQETLDLLGVKFKFDEENSFADIQQRFIDKIDDRYSHRVYTEEEEKKDKVKDARRCNNFSDIFYMARSSSWDLWGAAPFVAKLAFENYKLKNVPKSAGTGPVCNVIAQSVNLEVGLLCALLKDYGLIKDEKSFADFDT